MRLNLKGCIREYNSLMGEYNDLMIDYNNLMRKHNKLVKDINDKGGDEFLSKGIIPEGNDLDFSDKDIKDLLMLCHPDRHDNSDRATRVTRKLIILKKREFYY